MKFLHGKLITYSQYMYNVQFKPQYSVCIIFKHWDILVTGSGHQVFEVRDVTQFHGLIVRRCLIFLTWAWVRTQSAWQWMFVYA